MKYIFLILAGGMLAAFFFVVSIPVVSLPKAESIPRSGKEFHVTEFGALADGRTDAGPAFRRAIAAALAAGPGAVVRVGAGVWRLLPAEGENACLPITGARGLTVRGEPGGTELVIATPRRMAFLLNKCEETTIRGFTIDYDPLPFTQGKIVAVDLLAGTFDMTVDPGYPSLGEPMFAQNTAKYERWGMIMDSRTRWLKSGAPNFIFMGPITPLEGGIWRMEPPAEEGGKPRLRHMAPGDLFVQLARGGGAAFYVTESRACTIEDNTVYSSPSTSVTSVGNDALTVRGLRVRFKPGTDRLISTDADGVHCQNNIRGPLIENCSFEGMADDGINIYSRAAVVNEILAPTELIVGGGGTMATGDRLQIIDPKSGQARGETTVARIEPLAAKQKIILAEPVNGMLAGADHLTADTIYNLTRCGAGYVIRNNKFGRFRGRGTLLRAGDGLVEGNTYTDPSSCGIVLANEPDWPEGPIPWNVKIRGNTFIGGSSDPKILIRASRLGHQTAEGRPLRDVTIEGNRFINPPGTAISIGAARDIIIRNNQIEIGAGAKSGQPCVILANSQGVTIENLTVSDPEKNRPTAIQIDPTVGAGEAGVAIKNLKVNPAATPAVLDARTPASENGIKTNP